MKKLTNYFRPKHQQPYFEKLKTDFLIIQMFIIIILFSILAIKDILNPDGNFIVIFFSRIIITVFLIIILFILKYKGIKIAGNIFALGIMIILLATMNILNESTPAMYKYMYGFYSTFLVLAYGLLFANRTILLLNTFLILITTTRIYLFAIVQTPENTIFFKAGYTQHFAMTILISIILFYIHKFTEVTINKSTKESEDLAKKNNEFLILQKKLEKAKSKLKHQNKLLDKKAEEIEGKYKGVVDNMIDGFYRIDADGIINLTSPSFFKMLNFSENEMMGKAISSFYVRPKEREIFLNNLKKTGKVEQYVIELRKKDKTVVWGEVNAQIIYKNGEYAGVEGVFRDVSYRKKTEIKLKQSEKRLQTLINSVPDVICFKDGEGRWLIANDADLKLFKLEGVDYIGKKNSELAPFSPFYHDAFIGCENSDEIAWKKGKISRDIEIIPNPEGENYIYDIIKVPIFKTDNTRDALVVFGRDITELKKTEQELVKIKNELIFSNQSLLEQQNIFMIGNAVVFKWKNEKDWPVEYVSQNAENIFGYKADEFMIGKVNFSDLIHKEDITRIEKEVNDAINNNLKHFKHEEYRIINKKGEEVWLYDFTTIVRNKENEITHFFGYVMDVSNQKHTELELIKAKKEAETANRLKSEFLANMSHEIRTPMNAVLGFSEILKTKLSKSSEYKPFIDGIMNGGKNLITLINDILDLSKIEAGKLEIKKEPVNLLKLIEDVKQIFLVKIQKQRLNFLLEIDEQLPNLLLLDQTRIRQILFNLIGNAIKFTEKGFVSISIKIENNTKQKNTIDLFLEVKDTGIGIPENQKDKIFKAFQQTDGQLAKYGGTGLGLPITKRLTEAMNGEISVSSKLGEGSIFYIHFKSISLANIQIKDSKKEQAKLLTKSIRLKKPRILLVDDIESNREVVKFHLEDYNCKIYEAKNGQEALDLIKIYTPDLILMDISMPILDGYDATKQIRMQKELDQIPIIALTAFAMKEQERKGNIFDDYLKKPIDVEKLILSLIKFLPYTQKGDNIEEKTKKKTYTEVFFEEITKKGILSKEFMQQYSTEIVPLYEDVSDIMDMQDCNKFAKELMELGIHFKIPFFTKFGTDFKNASEKIHLTKIEQLLSEFSEINNKIANSK